MKLHAFLFQPGTVVVRRLFEITKMEGNTGRPKIGLRNRVYKLVERRLGPENLDIILTDDIDGMLLTACFDA